MLASEVKSLYESYQSIYEENGEISSEMIEEIVEELIEEYLELGYDLNEAVEVVEEAATEYLMELNPYAPAGSKEARAYQKSTTATRRGEARKAAVKGAVERVKAKARGVKAAAGIAGSIAKDEARRAGRATKQAVTSTAQKTKERVKSGVKGLLGKGLRAAAGAAGAVAQKARKAGAAAGRAAERLGEETDLFDVILEYLVAEGYADTNENALVIMANMSEEWREAILEATTTQRLADLASKKADEPGAKTQYKPEGPGFKHPRSKASIMNQIAGRAKNRAQHGVDSQYASQSEQPKRGGRSGRGSKTDRPATANMPNPNRKPKG